MNSVLLVDDHASFREMLALLFDREPDFEVVAQAGSLAEARRMLEGDDLAVVDVDLPDGDGTELVAALRAVNQSCAVLVLTASPDREVHARAMEAGADGVLHKSVHAEDIISAARRLVAGEALLSADEVVELFRHASRSRNRDYEVGRAIEQLTARELEVLQALADGLSDREIAERLYIGIGTVRNHFVNIFNKLGVHSRLQALVFALRHGVVKIG
jgi:two-component system, NarL family, response regulator DevR